LRRHLDRGAGSFFKGELVEPERAFDVENDAAGVLANRLGLGAGQPDVLLDDFHRAFGNGALLFLFQRPNYGCMNIIRDFSGGAANEFQQ